MGIHVGAQSAKFEKDIFIIETASTVGSKEGEGPLKDYFDVILDDASFGEESWEKAETKMVSTNIELLINKSSLEMANIDYIYAGDLLNQNAGSSFAVREFNRPFFGIFGACSTFGEGLSLGSINIESGIGSNIIVGASSHFCTAEKQFRFPLGLGTQRPPTSTWTVTGASAVILSSSNINNNNIKIKGITTGKIVDYGIKDANNMGSAMAPAAADVMICNFKDFNIDPSYYDIIFTGDLGYVGRELVIEIVKKAGYDISKNYTDCGIEMFDRETQNTDCGGSGCACSGATFAGMIYKNLQQDKFKRILFIPTGALMNTTTVQQGENVAGIAHAIMIEKE
ncbi:MAG: stage V sporulation protein AD [bacterium]